MQSVRFCRNLQPLRWREVLNPRNRDEADGVERQLMRLEMRWERIEINRNQSKQSNTTTQSRYLMSP